MDSRNAAEADLQKFTQMGDFQGLTELPKLGLADCAMRRFCI